MKDSKKILSLLGLAMRAGKITLGEDAVIKTIKKGKAKIVFVAKDVGESTKKKINDKCKSYNVKMVQIFTSEEQSQAIGKMNRVLIGVVDEGFANAINKQLK